MPSNDYLVQQLTRKRCGLLPGQIRCVGCPVMNHHQLLAHHRPACRVAAALVFDRDAVAVHGRDDTTKGAVMEVKINVDSRADRDVVIELVHCVFQYTMARQHQAPWRTDEQLIEVLELERAALAEQVAALREGRDIDADAKRELVLLCRYIVLGSAKRVADWANKKGWRLPGAEARGGKSANPPRLYTGDDVIRLVKSPPQNLPVSFGDLLEDVFHYRPD